MTFEPILIFDLKHFNPSNKIELTNFTKYLVAINKFTTTIP